jgi:putative tryptophan/tyrosine transport system substrate-binding protein
MGQMVSTPNLRRCVIISLFFRLESSGASSDPTSTGTGWPSTARRNKPMKAKVAVSIVSIFIVTFFCIAEAQQTTKTIPRIGLILSSGTAETRSPLFEAFRQGLQDLGYVDEKNVLIERRYAEGRLDRMSPFVQEFVQQKVDVILGTSNVVIRAAKEATKTTPIVMISSVDPVAAGYVESFAHPRGNITGLAWLSRDLSAKRVELLRELLPKMSRVGILWDADAPGPKVAFKEYTAAALAFKLDLRSMEVRGTNPDLVGAFEAARLARTEALIVVGNPIMSQRMKTICDLATKQRLPLMTEEDRYVEAGALISYGANLADLYRRAAEYVAAILKGAKPGDLPVKLASKFEIFINLNTAKQLGLVIPQEVLVQADKVIK